MTHIQINPNHKLTPLNDLQMNQLYQGLTIDRIAQRATPGGSGKMSYMEAWDIRRTLIRVFGFGGWTGVAFNPNIIKIEPNQGKSGKSFRVSAMVEYELYIHQLGVIYGEVAVSSQTGSDPGDTMDFAVKTAASDALKRCAMNMGTQFGLSLYDGGNTGDVVGKVFADDQQAIIVEHSKIRRRVEWETRKKAIAEGTKTLEAHGTPEPEQRPVQQAPRVAAAEPRQVADAGEDERMPDPTDEQNVDQSTGVIYDGEQPPVEDSDTTYQQYPPIRDAEPPMALQEQPVTRNEGRNTRSSSAGMPPEDPARNTITPEERAVAEEERAIASVSDEQRSAARRKLQEGFQG